jgi:hypothetical protein
MGFGGLWIIFLWNMHFFGGFNEVSPQGQGGRRVFCSPGFFWSVGGHFSHMISVPQKREYQDPQRTKFQWWNRKKFRCRGAAPSALLVAKAGELLGVWHGWVWNMGYKTKNLMGI